MSISEKCVVVTGSNSGRGVARELAKRGADVVLNSLSDTGEDHALADRIAAEHGVRRVHVPPPLVAARIPDMMTPYGMARERVARDVPPTRQPTPAVDGGRTAP